MKSNSNKKLAKVPVSDESSLLRMVYKNEEVINEEENAFPEEIIALKNKTRHKLFVKEPLPLFDDYKFKYKDHDPL